jgi:3-oxoacyl-[acyl-carrier-protein] synthase II
VRRRVVVTGVGAVTPIGNGLEPAWQALRENKSGVVRQEEWASINGLSTHLAAPVAIDMSAQRRKDVRTMGRVGRLSVVATDEAIADSGLTADELRSGQLGLAYGSTHGSTTELEAFCLKLFGEGGLARVSATSYLKFMSNTCAANLGILYGIRGQLLSTCSACVSASQAIGQGFEAIRSGQQEVMICGGAEELHYLHVAVFALLYATSTRNHEPDLTPRPFDLERDGLVVGEGASTLVLEEHERAVRRGAKIYGEVLGYGTNCDGTHITAPSIDGMAGAMELALADASLRAADIDYVNAHATGTRRGDVCESVATLRILGDRVPISSTKGHTGHTLGACGGIEAMFCLAALRDGFIPPNRNLGEVDPECSGLDYVREGRAARLSRVMNNNFAFGGVNTSLIFGRLQ